MKFTQLETYRIPLENWDEFNAVMAKMNAKAGSLGCEAVQYEVIFEGVDNRPEGPVLVKEVRVKGPAPKLEGWSFIGRVQPVGEEGEVAVFTVPGYQMPDEFKEPEAVRCDHCRIKRYRKATYVVWHESKGYKVVGSTCVKDFLGHKSPEQVARMLQWFRDVEKGMERLGGCCRRSDPYHELRGFLALAACHIRVDGWTSAKAAIDGYSSSKQQVLDHLWANSKERWAYDERYIIEDKDKELAEETIRWVRDEVDEKRNDYQYNLKLSFKYDAFNEKLAGIVTSAVHVYRKVKQQKMEHAMGAQQSKWVGALGTRVTVKAILSGARFIDGQFGCTTLYSFVDTDGNRVKWFSSRDLDLKEGESYSVTGRVKKHGEYKGMKQTILTRCKVAS